jgi:hypothetical protein
MPNILLVYPKFPLLYWGFQFAMDFVDRKACVPLLGLVTVAGMFPRETYRLREMIFGTRATPMRNNENTQETS